MTCRASRPATRLSISSSVLFGLVASTARAYSAVWSRPGTRLCEDWGSAYLITRLPAATHPYQAERRDDPAVVLAAATPDALRELIRADYLAHPVPREVAP